MVGPMKIQGSGWKIFCLDPKVQSSTNIFLYAPLSNILDFSLFSDSDSPGAASVLQGHRVVTSTASTPTMTKSDQSAAGTVSGATNQSSESQDLEGESRFQYILAAPTSILTKPGDPSLTYINQGQSYEIKIKKLGDISGHYKKKWLRGTIRICFHERRLQYIEAEQIAEWSRSHPNERILEIDM